MQYNQASQDNALDSLRHADAIDMAFFMPSFAERRNLYLLFSTINLLALFLYGLTVEKITDFNLISCVRYVIFLNWVTLISVGVVQYTRAWLMRQPRKKAVFASLFGFIGLIFALTLSAKSLLVLFGFEVWDTFSVLNTAFRNMIVGALFGALLFHYMVLREKLILRHRAELVARVHVLQSRLRPHFLFNTMNTILSLIDSDPRRAEQAIEDLCHLLRASIHASGEVPLTDEIEICEHYLAIEELRLSDRLVMRWNLPDEDTLYDIMIPAMTLQPLIENAVYYGVEASAAPSVICVNICVVDEQVSIQVSSPLPDSPKGAENTRNTLQQIQERLKVYYGAQSYSSDFIGDGKCIVTMRYPIDLNVDSTMHS